MRPAVNEGAPISRPAMKPWIEAIHAYVPGKSKAADGRKLVKLSANENPLGTSQAALMVSPRESARIPQATAPTRLTPIQMIVRMAAS